MDTKKRISSGTPSEELLGYCRAIRYGHSISISGTAAIDSAGKVVGKGDAYAQMIYIVKKVEAALQGLGASLDDVVMTRIFTRKGVRLKDVARAHKKYFGRTRPASTMVEVSGFPAADILVEVEVEAWVA